MNCKAPLLTVALLAGLSGCSMWPFHHHPKPEWSELDPSQAAPSAVAAEGASAPAAASSQAVVATPASGAADAGYAPFTSDEWKHLLALYSPLAACTDHYMQSAGINGQLLGSALVQLQKDQTVIGEARSLLGNALPPLADNAPVAARAALASKAVWLLMQDPADLGLGQTLARKALARYDLALVAGSACPLDPEYHALLGKALP